LKRVDHQARDSGAPASQRRGRLSSRPEDRATPVADASTGYAAYIAASDAAKVEGHTTVRIEAAVLDQLREQTQRTGSNKRPPELAAAIRRATRTQAAAPSRLRALPVLGAGAALAAAALWFALAHGRATTSAVPVPPATTAVEAAPRATAAPAAQPPATAAPAQPTHAEEQARAALERLRTGLGDCIRHGIHGLPGSSPAVPPALASLKGGAYTAAPAEWRTAVWSCAHFQVAEAMTFQIQWQLLKPGVDGVGVAWIHGDGVAEKALGFHITLDPRGAPVLGDVGPIAPAPAVIAVR